jgi:hypothetical protein
MRVSSGTSHHFSHTIKARRARRLKRPPPSFSLPVQQFHAPASHEVQDGVQQARPRNAYIRHRRQCAHVPPVPPEKADARCIQRPRSIRRNTAGVRTASGSLSLGWTTLIRVLAEWHFLRVLRRLDRRAQPECQDLPREALLSPLPTVRIVSPPHFLTSSTCICTRVL